MKQAIIKIIRRWLEWYTEKEADKLAIKYNKMMNKLERKDEKLDRFYDKMVRWLEK